MAKSDLTAITNRPTVQDHVYGQLRQALMWGQFEPGALMTVKALADQFQTSPMPVREALRRLAAECGLDVARNGSVRVPPVSRRQLDDLCRARKALEGVATESAAAVITQDLLDAALSVAREHERLGRAGEVYAMLRKNQEFHFMIYEHSGSDVLPQLIEMLWLRFGPYMRMLSDLVKRQIDEGQLPDYSTQHYAILDALSGRRATDARAAMERDIEATQAFLQRICPD